MQYLLVLLRLVVKLLQVSRPVVGVLRQHQLDVAAERQVLGEEEQHFGEHVGAEAAVSVCGESGREENCIMNTVSVKKICYQPYPL